MNTLQQSFLAFVLLFSTLTFAQDNVAKTSKKLDEAPKWTFKAGAGSTIEPYSFLSAGSIEYRLEDFISFVAMFQWSFGAQQDLIYPHLGGRIILPRHVLSSNSKINPLQLSAVFTAGPVFRERNNFTSEHVGFSTGISADVFLARNVSVGGTALANLTSSSVENFFASFYGHLGLHF